MSNSQSVLVWIKLGFLVLLFLGLRCSKQMEPSQIGGFDFQKYSSPTAYQSLYVQKKEIDYTIVSNGVRITGQLTENEHTMIFDLLNDENRDILRENNLLGSDSITYPYLSIKERAENISSNNVDFFVILDVNTTKNIPTQIIDLVSQLLVKYGE